MTELADTARALKTRADDIKALPWTQRPAAAMALADDMADFLVELADSVADLLTVADAISTHDG